MAEGADLLDVGGVKAGPGPEVGEAEELERVVPAIEALRARFDVPLSVDTWRAAVAAAPSRAGAVVGNDISGFADPDYLRVAAEAGASVVATHIRLEPRVADPEPHYDDVVATVAGFLTDRATRAEQAGIPPERIMIDAGLDLGKTAEQSLCLLRASGTPGRARLPASCCRRPTRPSSASSSTWRSASAGRPRWRPTLSGSAWAAASCGPTTWPTRPGATPCRGDGGPRRRGDRTGVSPAASGPVAVVLVKGEDPSLVSDAVRGTVDAALAGEDRSFALEELGGEDLPVGAIVDAALTAPFLTAVRVLVVRDVGRWSSEELAPLIDYLAAPLDTTSLVLVAGGGTTSQQQYIVLLLLNYSSHLLLFHDTHHRAVERPAGDPRVRSSGYDGVLAFGETLAEVYRRWGWGDARLDLARGGRHAPASIRRATEGAARRAWSGSATGATASGPRRLEDFLLAPGARRRPAARHLRRALSATRRKAMLARYGARYRGWLPNAARARSIRARIWPPCTCRAAPTSTILPGIPTIRVFEALACGIPLVSRAVGRQRGLFAPGEDYLVARDGAEMTSCAARARATTPSCAPSWSQRARDDPGAPHLRAPGRRAARASSRGQRCGTGNSVVERSLA